MRSHISQFRTANPSSHRALFRPALWHCTCKKFFPWTLPGRPNSVLKYQKMLLDIIKNKILDVCKHFKAAKNFLAMGCVITKHRKIVRCDGALENETKFFLCWESSPKIPGLNHHGSWSFKGRLPQDVLLECYGHLQVIWVPFYLGDDGRNWMKLILPQEWKTSFTSPELIVDSAVFWNLDSYHTNLSDIFQSIWQSCFGCW